MLRMEFWFLTGRGSEEITYIFLASRTNVISRNKDLAVISLEKKKEIIIINDIASEKRDGVKERQTMGSGEHRYFKRRWR